jgi:hypothetical protein
VNIWVNNRVNRSPVTHRVMRESLHTLISNMPFDPLQTDEKLDQAVPRERDMDSAMLAGCTGFVFTALATYALVVWPFLVFQDAQRSAILLQSIAIGLVPASLLGIIAARRMGLPGGSGFVAGAATASVFLFLDLKRIFVLAQDPNMQQPQYSPAMVWLLPLAWTSFALALAMVALPKGELPEKEDPGKRN